MSQKIGPNDSGAVQRDKFNAMVDRMDAFERGVENFKGFFPTLTDLQAAYPGGGQDGWHAHIGSTDTYYDWDGVSAWVNSGVRPGGARLLFGSVDPTTEGLDGDYYINDAAQKIFGPKASGAWPAGVSFSGTDGNTVLNGTGAPGAGLGVDGDFYIDTDAEAIYGPKASGAWGGSTSLKGTDGGEFGRDVVAISDNTSDLTTGTKFTWYSPPYAITITDIELSVLTAPTGASLIVDLHDDGTTVMSTNKCEVEAAEFHTKDATTQPAITAGSIAASSKLEAIIDQVGSTVAGAGAVLYVYWTKD